MNEFFNLLEKNEEELDSYVTKRLLLLDETDDYEEISLEDEGKIYPNWINTNTRYLPSGDRSKGFRIDHDTVRDIFLEVKRQLSSVSIDYLKEKVTDDILLLWMYKQVNVYFGMEPYDEEKRKEFYGYGKLNSIGESLTTSEIKGKSVARCCEKASVLNLLLKFLGYDSSLVLSEANGVGHAYCFIKMNGRNLIADPSFVGANEKGGVLPYIFEFNPNSDSIYFDPAEHGDNESLRVEYDFPKGTAAGAKK